MANTSFSSTLVAFATALSVAQLTGCAQPAPVGSDGQTTTARSYETTGAPTKANAESADKHSRVTKGIQIDVTGLGAMFLH